MGDTMTNPRTPIAELAERSEMSRAESSLLFCPKIRSSTISGASPQPDEAVFAPHSRW